MPLYAAVATAAETSKGCEHDEATDLRIMHVPIKYELEISNIVLNCDPAEGLLGLVDVFIQTSDDGETENSHEGEPVLLCKLDAGHNIQRSVKVRVGREDGLVRLFARYNNKKMKRAGRSDKVHVTGVWLFDESREDTFDEEDRDDEVEDEAVGNIDDEHESDFDGETGGDHPEEKVSVEGNDDDDDDDDDEDVGDDDNDNDGDGDGDGGEDIDVDEEEEGENDDKGGEDTDDDVAEEADADAAKKRTRII